jgi:hypothetical protein
VTSIEAVPRANLGRDGSNLQSKRRGDLRSEHSGPRARQWSRCQPRPQPSRTSSTDGVMPSSIEVGLGARGAARADIATPRAAVNARINSRICQDFRQPGMDCTLS